MAVEFRVLGPLEMCVAGRRCDVGGHKLRILLATLLLNSNEPVPVGSITEAIWGDTPPADPRAALQTYVTRVRRALRAAGSAAQIQHLPAGYRIRVPEDAVDVAVFRTLVRRADALAARQDITGEAAALRESLALWRGAPLADIDSERLHRETVPELSESWLRVVQRRVDLDLLLGRHGEVIGELRALTERHPLRERFWWQLMTALHRCGRRAEALAAFRTVSRRLADELGIDPGEELCELHRAILNGASPTVTGADEPAPGRPAPAQLPAHAPVLSGRDEALTALSDVLLDEGRDGLRICAVSGIGGVGKTSLALRWAHRHRDRFPDGQLFVNLRGFDPSCLPTAPAAALRGFLDALGVAAQSIPAELDAQAGLYRSLVADRRLLVLLDNARDAAQVIPLLPGSARCVVIVTSRDQLSEIVYRHGAHALRLDVLNRPQAAALLEHRLGARRLAADPEAVQQVITVCAGLPLALGISAARAAVSPGLPMSVIAAELADTTTRLDALDLDAAHTGLRAALSSSYAALHPEQARVFALLGSAAGPDIGLPATAALSGRPPGEAARTLRALEQQSILTQQIPGRWRMHDLVRRYAAESPDGGLSRPDRDAALRRLTDFYLHTGYAADRQLEPTRSPAALAGPAPGAQPLPIADAAAALTWFDAEHPGLLAVQRRAAAAGEHRLVWQVSWVLGSYLHRRGRLDDYLTSWRSGVAAAAVLADPGLQALAHRGLGEAYAFGDRHDEAIDQLRRALELNRRINDRSAEAITHRVLARAHSKRGDDEAALRHAIRALRMFEADDDVDRQANAHNGVGWYATRLGRYDQAHTHLQAALALAHRRANRVAEANILDSLGYLAHHTGRHDEAIRFYHRAIALARELGFDLNEADAQEHLADTCAAGGDHRQAREARQRALQLYRAQHRSVDAARVQQALTQAR